MSELYHYKESGLDNIWIQLGPGARFVDLPSGPVICERVAQAARQFQKSIVALCAACGRTVPDWWMSGWSNALALADYLAGR